MTVASSDHQLTIRGLPKEIATVPPGPDGPDDPAAAEKRAAWVAWRDQVIAYRTDVRAHTAGTDPASSLYREIERRLCAEDPACFIAVWSNIYEPRTGWGRTPGCQPAVPYPVQVTLLRWRQERRESTGPEADGLFSTSRDMGATTVAAKEADVVGVLPRALPDGGLDRGGCSESVLAE